MDRVIEFLGNHPLLVGSFIALWVAFIFNESRRGGKNIGPSEATHLINRENAMVVDLRSPDEYREGHITGAKNVTYANLNDETERLKEAANGPLILVCKTGMNSADAAKRLKNEGFDPIYRLNGGMGAWVADNLPVIKG